ncbi:MAG: pyridoxal-phosphate dependent enzyme [Flammeovirgaceae bacterium]|nr:pyridoxal-phosphate dependent enzyme [Flammeovirgaceae bacterium]
MENNFPSQEDIIYAHKNISPFIHCTPVLSSSAINEILGLEVVFKCENFQKIGAFKIRGATNAVLKLSDEEKKQGIATHSSGNHAQAIAYSAKVNNIPAYIVMPKNAPKVKVNAVKGYGAKVIMCEPNLQAREDGLNKVVEETGARFIHPYNDYDIITGQATAAKELIEQTDTLGFIMAPVGGGGLLAGSALSSHYFSSNTKIIAGEPAGADDAFQSFNAGHLIPSNKPNTIADGLLTSVGEKNFPIIQQFVQDIITVSDEEIISAMKLIWERMKIIVEPSSAVPFASLIKIKGELQGRKVGIILSGGNVDLGKLPF